MMLSRSRPIRVLLLFAVMVLVVGCASRANPPSAAAPVSSASSERTSRSVVVHADYRVFFETPSDFLRLSDEVLIGTVETERRSAIYGPSDASDAPRQNRILRVSVERILKGSSSNPVDVVTYGWTKINGEEEQLLVTADGVRMKVGDRVMLALVVGKDGERGPVTQSGAARPGP